MRIILRTYEKKKVFCLWIYPKICVIDENVAFWCVFMYIWCEIEPKEAFYVADYIQHQDGIRP